MNLEKILLQMRETPQNVRYADVVKVCTVYFGEPRQKGTSHCVFKTPWPGDPRVNVQDKDGKAKPYQVKQILAAIAKIQEKTI